MNSIFQNAQWLLDENIDEQIGQFLQQQGVITQSIKSLNWFGVSDTKILNYAFERDMIILTQDSDFGELATLFNQKYFGIIYLRPGHFNYEFHKYSLTKLFQETIEINSPFIIVLEHTNEKVKIRIRQA